MKEGESMSAIKAVPSLGIDPATGLEIYVKKNGTLTYEWDAADKVLCGDTEPDVYGNISTNLYWKGWNLNAIFQYSLGGDAYNSTLAQRVEGANPAYNADRRVLNDRWTTPDNTLSTEISVTMVRLTFQPVLCNATITWISLRFLCRMTSRKSGFNRTKLVRFVCHSMRMTSSTCRLSSRNVVWIIRLPGALSLV